jgi:hypothetical protein
MNGLTGGKADASNLSAALARATAQGFENAHGPGEGAL